MKKAILPLLAIVMAVAVTAAPATSASDPVRLSFDKSAVSAGVWSGTVVGDVSGGLTTVLTAIEPSGPIAHVEFDWIVSAGAQSFTAHLYGTLNTNTGAVVMNGTVVDGWLEGAQVHEAGQLVDAASLRFQGEIRVMPASA
jgi:hypothetical protein